MIDYTGSVRLHAPKLGRRVLEEGLRAADHETSVALSIPAGEILSLQHQSRLFGGWHTRGLG